MQTTLSATVGFDGIGLHSGKSVAIAVHPAPANSGIVFERTDMAGAAGARCIRVSPEALVESSLCTRLQNASGVTVSTVEHLMAALAGCGIHNAHVTLDGGEVPILDGSAWPFVTAFLDAGIRWLDAPLTAIRVLRPVQVSNGPGWARLEPAPAFSIAFEIDFPDAAIGRQRKDLALCNGTFVRELADSRTFCRQADVDFMRANGLALGGSYENAVVVDGEQVLNPGGLRHGDEPVRHKMLDALGDLAAAGAPILGRYIGHRAGHALTARLVRALMANPANHELVEVRPGEAHCLPGFEGRRADLAAPVPAPVPAPASAV